jgi:hypothetical protein
MSSLSEYPCNKFSSNRWAPGGIKPRTKIRDPVCIRHDCIDGTPSPCIKKLIEKLLFKQT